MDKFAIGLIDAVVLFAMIYAVLWLNGGPRAPAGVCQKCHENAVDPGFSDCTD